jgi:Lysozyme like domain
VTREEEIGIAVLIGLYLWSEWEKSEPFGALQRGGAKVFDITHADSGHSSDLPRPDRMLQARLDRLRQHASSAGFQGDALRLAIAVGMAESGGIPTKVTTSPREHSVGLWQINIKAHPQYTEQWLLDPTNNARAAYELSKAGTDWHPWAAFTTPRAGKTQPPYLEYMEAAAP